MRTRRTGSHSSRAVSETLGAAVLIGMTILVTASLGLGVLVISEEEQRQTAEFDFTFLTEQIVIEYQDENERVAGNLYIDGPHNNVSWAAVDDSHGPDDEVGEGTFVSIGPNTAYGAGVSEDDTFDMVYFTPEGERVVLYTWNEADEFDPTDTPTGPEEPPGPAG